MYCFAFFLLIFAGGGAYALDARRSRWGSTIAPRRGLAKKSPAPATLTGDMRQRTVAKNARMSSTNNSGCSNAAKCPPRASSSSA